MKAELKCAIHSYYSWWRMMNDLYEAWARQHGLHSFSLYVLKSLYENPDGCTQKRICEEWMLPKQTVNSILKSFEERGYTTSQVSETDRRKRLLFLTDAGAAYARGIIGELDQVEENIMEEMGKEAREAMNEGAHLFCRLLREKVGGTGT